LGDKAKDTVTGFTGTATAYHEYLNGCKRFTLTANTLKDGVPIEPQTFDVEQLELIEEAKPRAVVPAGGPQKEPSRPSIPAR
jgi:hypothetical protein